MRPYKNPIQKPHKSDKVPKEEKNLKFPSFPPLLSTLHGHFLNKFCAEAKYGVIYGVILLREQNETT
jgi:hypothetical protein